MRVTSAAVEAFKLLQDLQLGNGAGAVLASQLTHVKCLDVML